MNAPDPRNPLEALRQLPVEVDLGQVHRMVAAFPLAMGTMARIVHALKFHLNTILMCTIGSVIIGSGLFLLGGGHGPRPSIPVEHAAVTPTAVPAPGAENVPGAPPPAPPAEAPARSAPMAAPATEMLPPAPVPDPEEAPVPEPLAAPAAAPMPAPPGQARATSASPGERTFDLRDFTGIDLSSAVDMEVEEGDFSVVATGDPRILEKLVASVRGGVLEVRSDGPWRIKDPAKTVIHVRMPMVRQVTLSGSGDAQVRKFTEIKELRTVLTGSGDLSVAEIGKVAAMDMAVTGSGDISMAGVGPLTDLSITLNGSGDLNLGNLDVEGTLTINSMGSGDIALSGRTNRVAILLAGSGDLEAGKLAIADGGKVVLTGSGDAELNSAKPLEMLSSGSGKVRITGGAGR